MSDLIILSVVIVTLVYFSIYVCLSADDLISAERTWDYEYGTQSRHQRNECRATNKPTAKKHEVFSRRIR